MSDLTDYLVFDIMGDLCFGKSFERKEPGENPFRHMPHTIADFMQFMYPLLFYVARYPGVYAKLVEEIRKTFKLADDIQTGTTLSSCKYLQACIEEALRVMPAGVGELAREVLPGGLDIEGIQIPEGAHVSVTAWSIMHNQECFGDPWVFRPERWIADSRAGETTEDVARARTAFNPFTIGPGNCVGQKFAMEELLVTVARTLHRMDVRIAPGNSLGGGASKLGWGLRDKDHIVLKDSYVSIRNGPMVQFRNRVT
ncbi:cytochrome P450 [Amylocarpus encephaloides]|uniref:Cytochrome P450 n=1 Tax=Amylocarpus encephaloides TaxID=45428 RepID=A0A9P8BY73_9HELO|nr:cytochrome P450 [Amylocarpus encephaloides]